MLDKSKAEWASASAEEKRAAEAVAQAYLLSELEADLIPTEEANRIVDGHRAQCDETWARATHGILIGLRRAGLIASNIPPDANSLQSEFLNDNAARADTPPPPP